MLGFAYYNHSTLSEPEKKQDVLGGSGNLVANHDANWDPITLLITYEHDSLAFTNRIGLWGPLCYVCNKEPPNLVLATI